MNVFLPKSKFFVAVMLLFVCGTFAATNNYIGANNGDWNTASNWSTGLVPTASDDVVIPSAKTVNISSNSFAKTVSISGTLKINDTKRLTVSGDFTVNSGGSFLMPTGSGLAELGVYGNYINNGITDFWKSTVVIAGSLLSPQTSTLQKQGNVIVGGDIIGVFDTTGGNGTGQIYAVDPNATVTITPVAIDGNVTPGIFPSSETIPLIDFVNLIIYGGACTFTISDPGNTSVCSGYNATIAVVVSGTIQTGSVWQVNKNDGNGWVSLLLTDATYSGVATTSLTIPIVAIGMDKYKYRFKATVGVCTKNGNYGILTINASPTITTQPINQLDCEGASVNFSVVASGASTYTWQYKLSGGSFASMPASNVTYPAAGKITVANVGSAQFPNGTQFQVIVSNGTCSVTSSSATLSVNEIVDITPITTSVTQCYATNYTYTVSTSYSTNVVSYQWKSSVSSGIWNDVVDGIHFSGAKTATLNIINGTPAESAGYRVYITFNNSTTRCSVDSSTRTRSIVFLPQLTLPQTTVTQPNCITGTGTIVVTVQSASDTYSFDNGGNYQVSNTKSGLTAGYYNVIIKNAAGCISSTSNVLINASSTKTWAGSWTPSAPSEYDTAIFASGTYNSTGDLAVCSCQVKGATVTFLPGHTLTVTNAVTVSSGSLSFNDSASLVQINNVDANSGNISYERIPNYARNTDYVYWSSPVLGQTIGLFSPNTLSGKYYSFDDTTNAGWVQEGTGTVMQTGKGYIIRGQEAQSGFPAPPPSSYVFNGKPNNGYKEIVSIVADKSYLIGNPYPSALDADTFLLQNKDVLYGTLYFWTHATEIGKSTSNVGTGALPYTQNDYASYNFTGGVGVGVTIDPANLSASTIPTGKIGAGQGFFASSKPTITGTKIVFNNSARVGVNGILGTNTQFFKLAKEKTTNVIEKNRVWLNLTNTQGAFKQTLIGYVTGATNGIDDVFDGESFDGQEFVDFYSVNQDKNLTIQGRALPFDENDSVLLGFRSTIEGPFTISIDQVDGSMTNQAVFIEDKLTNTIFDLKSGNYNFNTIAGTFNERFVLLYTNPNGKTLGTDTVVAQSNKVLVSNKNKQIKVNSFSETIDKVSVYDLLGRQVYQKANVNSNEFSISNLGAIQQTLIVKTVLQNGETDSTKIIY